MKCCTLKTSIRNRTITRVKSFAFRTYKFFKTTTAFSNVSGIPRPWLLAQLRDLRRPVQCVCQFSTNSQRPGFGPSYYSAKQVVKAVHHDAETSLQQHDQGTNRSGIMAYTFQGKISSLIVYWLYSPFCRQVLSVLYLFSNTKSII